MFWEVLDPSWVLWSFCLGLGSLCLCLVWGDVCSCNTACSYPAI